MHLVEVEPVAPQPLQRLLQLRPHSPRVVAQRLARHEEPLAHGRDEWSEQLLGPPVLGGDVEVVDPGGEGLVEHPRRGLGVGVPQGGGAEDGHRRLVSRPSQPARLHAQDGTAPVPPPPPATPPAPATPLTAARPPVTADRGPGPTLSTMATKSRPTAEPKKPGKSLKEKRAAKHEKQAAQKQARSAK